MQIWLKSLRDISSQLGKKLVNVQTSLNNLKTKIDDLNVDKLKNVPVGLKKLSDVVVNEVVQNTNFNTRNTKVNNLENKIPDTNTYWFIHINQYNTAKQNLEKKMEMLIKNTRYEWFSGYNYFEYKY